MIKLSRRAWLGTTTLAVGKSLTGFAPAVAETIGSGTNRASSLRITGIRAYEILLPYDEFHAATLFRYHGLNIQLRTVYIVDTNVGIVGYGENWGPSLPAKTFQSYIGTNPFDWIADSRNLAINMAMYDIMGKFLDLPAWRLLGPQVRDRIPVCAWTVSQRPSDMAKEVQHAAKQGYRWLKYHTDEVQNVVDQTSAMQAVAPQGFQVHYDFNANATYEAILPVLEALGQYPVAGRFEDPLVATDPAGWQRLHEQISLPIYVHHGPIEFLVDGIVDGLMAGHAPIGSAIQTAAVAKTKNIPFMLQQCGGTINQAFLAHEASVFEMATLDHCNLAMHWTDDITSQRMPIRDGHVSVPEGPGLGVSIDREKLEHYANRPRPSQEPFLVRIRYQDGPTIYCRHNPEISGATDNMRYLARLLGTPTPGPKPAYNNQVVTDFWDDRDATEFQQLWNATKSGPVVQ